MNCHCEALRSAAEQSEAIPLKKAQSISRYVIVSIPEECVTIPNGIASIMVKVLIEVILLWIATSRRSSQ